VIGREQLLQYLLGDPFFYGSVLLFIFIIVYFYRLSQKGEEKELEERTKRLERKLEKKEKSPSLR
jgi:hypothetical protein